jgi:hypothetical protein
MDRFTFSVLNRVSETPEHVPGYIAEFGSGSGQTVIAKYVKVATSRTASVRVGEPLFLLGPVSTAQTTYTNPYNPFLVSPDYELAGSPVPYLQISGIAATGVFSMVGCAAGVYDTAGLPALVTIASTPYMWCVVKGPIKKARLTTAAGTVNYALKPAAVGASLHGSCLVVATSASDFIVGYQAGAGALNTLAGYTSEYIGNVYISMPRWW